MDAPAEQTMQGKDNVPDNYGWTAYEIGICEFWKEPLGFLCSMICPCAVYGVTFANARNFGAREKPMTVGSLELLRPRNACLWSFLYFALPCCCCPACPMVPFTMYWLKKDFKVDRMPDDPYACNADCLAFTCLPCCAVYQDYAEVKLRMNRRWAERLAEDHPNEDEMTS
tara:strand:+ start:174 stop:683 length:510 start_codon:yes stop_codon:yes gene_type:complete